MRAEATTSVMPIEAGSPLPDAAGGTAIGLQRIAAAGLPVPDSWCLLPGAGEGDLAELTRELERRGHHLLAVRSSGRNEDLENASFAGVHVSVLGVRLAELPAAVQKVAVSSLSARAQACRQHLGLPPATERCAVVVQPMIPGEWAGVAFGLEGDRVVIEAVRGLGETLVEGHAVPESASLSWSSDEWRVDGRRPSRQSEALLLTDEGFSRVALIPDHEPPGLLSPALCGESAGGVATLEAWEGRRLDVEWVSRAGAVWFVLARPQTRPLPAALPPGSDPFDPLSP